MDPLSPVVVRFLVWQDPSGMVRAMEDVFGIEDCSASSSGKNFFFNFKWKWAWQNYASEPHLGGRSRNPCKSRATPSTTEQMNLLIFSCFCIDNTQIS